MDRTAHTFWLVRRRLMRWAPATLAVGIVGFAWGQTPSGPTTPAARLKPPREIGPDDRGVVTRGIAPDFRLLDSSTPKTGTPQPTIDNDASKKKGGWLVGPSDDPKPLFGTPKSTPDQNRTMPVNVPPSPSTAPKSGSLIESAWSDVKGFVVGKPTPPQTPPTPIPAPTPVPVRPVNTTVPPSPVPVPTANPGVYVGPPAYRWYGWGTTTPGANPMAPNGQYPRGSANWYAQTGATPGAFPAPATTMRLANLHGEPEYAPTASPPPLTTPEFWSTNNSRPAPAPNPSMPTPAPTQVMTYPPASAPMPVASGPVPIAETPPPPMLTRAPTVAPTVAPSGPTMPVGSPIPRSATPTPATAPATTPPAATIPLEANQGLVWSSASAPGESAKFVSAVKPATITPPPPTPAVPAPVVIPGRPTTREPDWTPPGIAPAEPRILAISRPVDNSTQVDQAVRQACTGLASVGEVRQIGPNQLAIKLTAATEEMARAAAETVSKLPILRPYEIGFQAQIVGR